MKMRKILALLLATLMCISMFAACGGKNPANTVKPSEAPATPPASETDLPSETPPASETDLSDSDYGYIIGKGALTIGITIYEPMNYYGADNVLTGFDTEFALAVCDRLNLEADFVEINWDTKEIELAAKTIDCIWNGMTITDERAANMSISLPYVKNAQVILVKSDSGITSTADLIGKTVVAEIGSAGESQIIGEGRG